MADSTLGRDDFRPTADWKVLRVRAALLRRVREFFDARGFLEVETPILSADTVVDRHLDPFWVELSPRGARRYLQTSPEYAMKRLLAAGGEAIYQVARVFRREELGRLHNPEFTMVEWYRTGDGLREGMELLSTLAEALLARGAAERVSYREAFERYAGIDPQAAETAALADHARYRGLAAPGSLSLEDRDGWLDLLLMELVEPHLGRTRPAILYDYPASQAALARVRPGESPVAERFELYADGIELANGYHELVDAGELRRRNAIANELRRREDKEPLPEESRLLVAMDAGLPAAAGAALGFDRVVMLAVGAKRLEDVIAFPFDRA